MNPDKVSNPKALCVTIITLTTKTKPTFRKKCSFAARFQYKLLTRKKNVRNRCKERRSCCRKVATLGVRSIINHRCLEKTQEGMTPVWLPEHVDWFNNIQSLLCEMRDGRRWLVLVLVQHKLNFLLLWCKHLIYPFIHLFILYLRWGFHNRTVTLRDVVITSPLA